MKIAGLLAATVAAASALAATVPGTAHAHPDVDRAIERVNDADFDGALAAFAAAEAATDLTMEELTTLFARRAGVHLALGDEAAASRDLSRLAALSPDYTFGLWAPPSLREAFARARNPTPVALRVEPVTSRGETRFDTRVEGDPGGLVRSVRVIVRPLGGARWTSLSGDSPVFPAVALEYYAEAIGPGGVVVARSGSSDAPRRIGPIPVEHAATASDDSWMWWAIGGGAAAIVAVVVIVAAVAATSGGSGQTLFDPPMVRFP